MQERRHSKQLSFRNEIRAQTIHNIFQEIRDKSLNQSPQIEWEKFIYSQSTSIPSICVADKQQLIIEDKQYIDAIERIMPDSFPNLIFLNNTLRKPKNQISLPLSLFVQRTLMGLNNFKQDENQSSLMAINMRKEEMFLEMWKNILKKKVRIQQRLLIQIINIFIKWWNNQDLPLNYSICSAFIEQLVPLNLYYSFLKPIISTLMSEDCSLETFSLVKTILQYKQPFEVAWVLLHPDLMRLLSKMNKHSIGLAIFILFKSIETKANKIDAKSPQVELLVRIVQIYIERIDKQKQQVTLNCLYNIICLDIDISEYWNDFPYRKVLSKTSQTNYLVLVELYLNILWIGDVNLQQKIILDENIKIMEMLKNSSGPFTQHHVEIMILIISILDENIIYSQEARQEVIRVFQEIRETMFSSCKGLCKGLEEKMNVIYGYEVQS